MWIQYVGSMSLLYVIVFFQDKFGTNLLNDDELMSALYLRVNTVFQVDGFSGSDLGFSLLAACCLNLSTQNLSCISALHS